MQLSFALLFVAFMLGVLCSALVVSLFRGSLIHSYDVAFVWVSMPWRFVKLPVPVFYIQDEGNTFRGDFWLEGYALAPSWLRRFVPDVVDQLEHGLTEAIGEPWCNTIDGVVIFMLRPSGRSKWIAVE
jgi:hypothetical protein